LGKYKYKAFISYSHKDESWGRWLHRRLETYPIPTNLVGRPTNIGAIPKRLKPIFRDREELAAADDLGEKIEQALANSENLVVICSPDAAESHWVNQEVLSFKRNNREAQVFCLIVGGEPFASSMRGREQEECFPSALRFQLDKHGALTDIPAEPLAADIRTQGDGKRLGVLKLVSGMIGVGLDEIVQRDMRRGRKRVTAITASALAAVLTMGTLTGFALSARKEADARRNDAEGLIEFMLTDLKDKLEPVGSLDVLLAVADRATNYYDHYPLSAHDDDALGRRARLLHYSGKIQYTLGRWEDATRSFERAYEATQNLFADHPNNPERIFEHAQSAYWIGYLFFDNGQYEQATPFYEDYLNLAEKLRIVEKGQRPLQELSYAYTNLGSNQLLLGELAEAQSYFEKAIGVKNELSVQNPNNRTKLSLANGYGWLSDSYLFEPSLRHSVKYRELANDLYSELIKENPKDLKILRKSLSTQRTLSRLALLEGELDTAKRHAEIGLKRVKKIEGIELNNLYAKREAIGLQFLQAEMYLHAADDAKVTAALKSIEKIISDIEADKDGYLAERVRFYALQTHRHIAVGNFNQGKDTLSRAKIYLRKFNKTDVLKNQEMIEILLLDIQLNEDEDAFVALTSKCKLSKLNIYPNYIAQIITVKGRNNCPQFRTYTYGEGQVFGNNLSHPKTKKTSGVSD